APRLAPFVDPGLVARAALLAVDLLSEAKHKERLAALARIGSFDLALLDRTNEAARETLEVLRRVDAPTGRGPRPASEATRGDGEDLRRRMMATIEECLDDFEEPHIWLEAIRLADVALDLPFDLRILAHVYQHHRDVLVETASFDARDQTRAAVLA